MFGCRRTVLAMKKKQYPPQKGPLVVKVKSGQSTDRWQDFKVARLHISVGQEYHEGEKLRALAEWSKARFEKVIFCANDTLQRFNLMYEQAFSEAEAYQTASALGQAWITRNLTVIAQMEQAETVRWEQWKANSKYSKGFLKIEWLYQNNPEFKEAIDENILAIWKRKQKSDAILYDDKRFTEFASLSRQYLLEEMAVFSLMYETETAIDIYPGTTLFAATKFRGRSIEGAPDGLGKGHFCRIDFAKHQMP